jgi:hypothetical protein
MFVARVIRRLLRLSDRPAGHQESPAGFYLQSQGHREDSVNDLVGIPTIVVPDALLLGARLLPLVDIAQRLGDRLLQRHDVSFVELAAVGAVNLGPLYHWKSARLRSSL